MSLEGFLCEFPNGSKIDVSSFRPLCARRAEADSKQEFHSAVEGNSFSFVMITVAVSLKLESFQFNCVDPVRGDVAKNCTKVDTHIVVRRAEVVKEFIPERRFARDLRILHSKRSIVTANHP